MRSLLLAVVAAYLIAAIHSILAFVNKRRSLQRVAEWSTAAGFILHTGALVADWVIDGHYPLFSLLEALSIGSSPNAPATFSTTWLFPIHTTLLIFAYAAFSIAFMASVMYLLQERELKLKTFGAIFHRLPPLTTVNELATSAAALGLLLLTLGIVSGVIWSSTRFGRYWRNDPKEIFALLTWLLYFVLIIYRLTANWRGRSAAWLGVVGFALVLLTFFGARFLGGYHVFG